MERARGLNPYRTLVSPGDTNVSTHLKRWTVSKPESVHRVINRRSVGRAVQSGLHRQIKTDVSYLENLAERLSDQTGLPLDRAHERVMALAVSARPRPSAPFFGGRGQ